jgi:hypothetical protein
MEASSPTKLKPSIPYQKRRSRSLTINKLEQEEKARLPSSNKL